MLECKLRALMAAVMAFVIAGVSPGRAETQPGGTPSPSVLNTEQRASEPTVNTSTPEDAASAASGANQSSTGMGRTERTPPQDADRPATAKKPEAKTPSQPETANDPAGAPETAPVAQPLPEPLPRAPRPEDIMLKVATWGGAYNAAQERALFAPFTADTGHPLDNVYHDGELGALTAAWVKTAGWDLVEVDALTARRGCETGWLKKISPNLLPKSVEGGTAAADYLPGALMECAAGSAAWSAVAVYDQRAAFGEPPQDISALFDLARYPGKRALPRQAPYVLEFALLADGIAPEAVYETLATPAGQDRAFAKLSSMRHAIVWWEDAASALAPFPARKPEDLEDVVMGVAFNGRVFTDTVRAKPSLRILWDGQIYRFNYWAIPASSPHPEAAEALLRYVSMPERQARLTRWFPYGPVRASALPLVAQHGEIDIDMAGFVPTMPRNMAGALRFDAGWWQNQGAGLKDRFRDWLALPAPQVPADQLVPPTPVRALRAHAMTIQ